MVARALLLNPRVLLADEPVSMVDASLRATILESLVKLKRELGISLVYITHDLTTAYQASQNIYILYRGSVAEVGSVEKVIGDPKHPYTRLLVSSVPLPDPDVRWGGETEIKAKASAPGARATLVHGCKFANRCPYVMAECRQAAPPLYRTDDDRAVACYLHKDSPEVTGREMAEVLAAGRAERGHGDRVVGGCRRPDLIRQQAVAQPGQLAFQAVDLELADVDYPAEALHEDDQLGPRQRLQERARHQARGCGSTPKSSARSWAGRLSRDRRAPGPRVMPSAMVVGLGLACIR